VPFVGPEVQERARGGDFTARIGANENVFGPSPKAVEAMRTADPGIWMYADPTNHDLIGGLAAHHGVPSENIMVGEGIDGMLGYLCRMLLEPGDAVVTSDGAYPTFNFHVAGFGGVLHKVPYKGDHEDPEALFAKAAEVDAKLVYLANPDNPMGTSHTGAEIIKAMDKLPDGTLFILDEAYIEFAPEGIAAPIDIDDPRVIRMRTFSKAYGMAGARVGYALAAAPLITAFNKIRNHFGMNRSAQIGALAALRDPDWLAETVAKVASARAEIDRIAQANGLTTVPSATNFVAIDCGQDGDFARKVLANLIEAGIFARMPFVAPQDRCIRVSCGTPEDLAAFEATLPKALEKARSD
jgi:histidinol-phosphate aminotransferase